MAKKSASAQEIQAEILRRIRSSGELSGSCRNCGAPLPRSVAGVPFEGNWTVDALPGLIPGCRQMVEKIIRDVRAEYDLKV